MWIIEYIKGHIYRNVNANAYHFLSSQPSSPPSPIQSVYLIPVKQSAPTQPSSLSLLNQSNHTFLAQHSSPSQPNQTYCLNPTKQRALTHTTNQHSLTQPSCYHTTNQSSAQTQTLCPHETYQTSSLNQHSPTKLISLPWQNQATCQNRSKQTSVTVQSRLP